jgi:Zn-dependent protease
LPHVVREPFGTVIVPLLSYLMNGWMMGWASAPYDPHWEDRYPRRAAAMALAGPGANLVLALLAFLVLRVGLAAGWWLPALDEFGFDRLVSPPAAGAGAIEALGRLLSILLGLNVLLLVFNLIPVPPLDGAAVAAGLVPGLRPLRQRMRASGMGALIGLVLAWLIVGRVFGWVYVPVLHMLFAGHG